MVMNGARLVIWILGLALVVTAAWMLFFQTGLNHYVPLTIAGAGLLLIVGVAIMSMSEKMRSDRTHVEEHHEHH